MGIIERLRTQLEERERVLGELQDIASHIAEKIATYVPDGMVVEVDGYQVKPWTYVSVLAPGEYRTLVILPAGQKVGWRAISNFGDGGMGSVATMPCDENIKIFIASENVFVFFAKNLERIIDAFGDK